MKNDCDRVLRGVVIGRTWGCYGNEGMRVAINSNYKSAGDLFAAGSLCALICDCHGLADAAARRAPDRDGHRTFSGSRSFFVQFGVVLRECQLLRIARKCYGFLGRFTILRAYGKYLTGFGGFTGLYFIYCNSSSSN